MSKFMDNFRKDANWVIPKYECELPAHFIEIADEMATRQSSGIGKLAAKCETLRQLQDVIKKRYSKVLDTLAALKSHLPSVKRFCDTCVMLCKALEISIREDDISVEYSWCLATGLRILAEEPGESRHFNKEEREEIVKSFVSFVQSFHEYIKVFYGDVRKMGKMDDLIDIPLYMKVARGDLGSLIFDDISPDNYAFKPRWFADQAVQLELRALFLQGLSEETLSYVPPKEYFSKEVIYCHLLLALGLKSMKHVLYDPKRFVDDYKRQYDILVSEKAKRNKKDKAIEVLQEKSLWINRLRSMLEYVGNDEDKKHDIFKKLENAQAEVFEYMHDLIKHGFSPQEIKELEAQVAPVTDAQQNGNEQGFMGKEIDYQLVSDPETQQDKGNGKKVLRKNATIACTKKLKREHKSWKSCYAGKDIPNIPKSVLCVEQDGQTIVVGRNRWRLTAKQAGDWFDKLIQKQSTELKSEKKCIDFSNKAFQRFKRMKCINDNKQNYKNFFVDVIEIEKSKNGRKIVGAHFNKKLFSN